MKQRMMDAKRGKQEEEEESEKMQTLWWKIERAKRRKSTRFFSTLFR